MAAYAAVDPAKLDKGDRIIIQNPKKSALDDFIYRVDLSKPYKRVGSDTFVRHVKLTATHQKKTGEKVSRAARDSHDIKRDFYSDETTFYREVSLF